MNTKHILTTVLCMSIFLPIVCTAQTNFYKLNYIEPSISNTTTNSVNIIVESDTYTPSFYKGRAEPTGGNGVRLIALPVGIDLEHVKTLFFRWEIDGNTLSGPTQGLNSVSFIAPTKTEVLVRLHITDSNGTLVAEAAEYIPISKPEIAFYEDNQLRGHSRVAIGGQYTMVGDESTIRMEPFFISPFNDSEISKLNTAWTINGKETPTENWQFITFTRPSNTDLNYTIGFTLQHKSKLLETADDTFTLAFGL